MSDRILRIAGAFFLAGMGALALTAVGALAWAVWPEAWRGETAANWASAVGTFAAAVIALLIALRDGFRRNKEEWTKARLSAARLYETLAQSRRSIKACIKWLDQRRTGFEDQYTANMYMYGVNLMQYGHQVLFELAPLPNDAALNLARALDITSRVQPLLSNLQPAVILPESVSIHDICVQCAADLRVAEQLVCKAMEECRLAAGIEAVQE